MSNEHIDEIIERDVKELHGMGYAQELLRRMSGFSNFAISFSIICILAGGITSYQLAFCSIGGAGIGVVWILGTLLTLTVATAMAQVASAYPTAGGLYHWSSILGGKGWGWATAWFNWLGLIFVIAAVNVGAYTIIKSAVIPMLGIDTSAWGEREQMIGLCLITFSHALFNHFGIKVTTLLTDLSGYLILTVTVLLVIAMFAFAPTHDFSRLIQFTNYSGDAGGGVWPANNSLFILFLVAMLHSVYTITGYDASAHTSEETINAAKNVPKGILQSVWISGLFGYLLVVSILIAIPNMDEAAKQGGNIYYWLMDTIIPKWAEVPLWWGIAISNYLCGLACVTSASRMTFAFARDGGLPASNFLRHVSPSYRTPVYAIWATAALAVATTLYTPAYSTLTVGCVIFLYLSYVMPTAAGILTIGKTWTHMGPFNIGTVAYKIVGTLAIVGVLAIIYAGIQPPNDKALTVTGVMILALLAFWFLGVRKIFKGPPTGSRIQQIQGELTREEHEVGQ